MPHDDKQQRAAATRRTFMKASGAVAGLGVASGSATADAHTQEETRKELADTILYNGRVLTADSDDPNDMTVASAVAIRDGKVIKVSGGRNCGPAPQGVQQLVDSDTTKINLEGRTVIPGAHYNDADNSVPGGDIDKFAQWDGQFQTALDDMVEEQFDDLTQITTEDIMGIIEDITSAREPGEFTIITAEELGPAGIPLNSLTKEDLDDLAPNFPLAVLVASGNASVVNSIMLELILEETPLTTDDNVQIITDENGEPTGQLGQQATGVIGAVLRPIPTDYIESEAVPGGLEAMKAYAMAGVTGANGHMSGLTATILNVLHRQDQVPMRVFPWLQFLKRNPFWKSMLSLNGNFSHFERSDHRGPMIRFPGASIGPHSGAPDDLIGALTIEETDNPLPQAVSPTGANKWTAEVFTGKSFEDLSQDELEQIDWHNFQEGRRHGWTFGGMHNYGSKAIDLAIDMVEAAEQQDDLFVSEKFGTYGLDHNVDWLPEIVDKAAEKADDLDMRFGVALNEAMDQRDNEFLEIDNVVSYQYGEEGLERWAPLKTLLENDIPFHIEGSDPDDFPEEWPMWNVQKAVTRVDRRGVTVAPEEALTRKEALTALTRWGARFMGMEDEFGSIEEGKWADIVVLDKNYLEVPADQIEQVRPVATFVGGEPSFVEDSYAEETGLKDRFPDVEPDF